MCVISSLVISACAPASAPEVVEVPRMAITCPDPDDRARLTDTSTYRDLARSRAEAINGWTVCSDALKIYNKPNGEEK
ncbi:hypothetical protein Z949_1864 [Sulfitobacter guttiformis KCTC 32187]|nr:hypothetical protein Z949_1864 [Sulfitobacter guttiformis KCTC 32187]